MTEYYSLTTGQQLQAQRIKTHRPGATAKYIALHIGATEEQVRQALKIKADRPASVPRAKRVFNRLRPGLKVTGYSPGGHRRAAGVTEPQSMTVPHDVLLERDQRLALQPHSLTAALCGDPLPGQREYLDGLAARPRR